ncbi:MAG: hypothetical protein EXS68_00455 [Candidatus Ryanbacteria bacterium]|nr:hypothetical protein [Candidatus Ryanbacteria bacterium]
MQTQQAGGDAYRALVSEIVRMGKVDRSIVMRTAHVGSGEAYQLIDRMQEDGIISKPDRKTSERRVLITPEELARQARVSGAPRELDAETRTILELLTPTLAEREELSVDSIRTEFAVEADVARDVIAELARQHKTGEPDKHGTAMVLITTGGNDRAKAPKPILARAPVKDPPTGIRGSIGMRPPLLRGEVPPPTPAPAATTIARKCVWPDCEQTKIQSRNLCQKHYMVAYMHWKKIGGGQRTSKPFPIPAEVIKAKSEGVAIPTPPPAPEKRASIPALPSPPAAPTDERPWQTRVATAQQRADRVESENMGLRNTIARFEREAREHETAWKTLADFIERQPTLRRLLHLQS